MHSTRNLPRFWLTRTFADNNQVRPALLKLGYRPFSYPLLQHQALVQERPNLKGCAGLIFTSRRGVDFLGGGFPVTLPVLCVGSQTAAAARAVGFRHCIDLKGDRRAVLEYLANTKVEGWWLHPTSAQGIGFPEVTNVQRYEIYKTHYRETLSATLVHHLVALKMRAVLVASVNAARCLDRLWQAERSQTLLFALSPTILENAGKGWQAGLAPEQPEIAALLRLIPAQLPWPVRHSGQ